MPKRTRSTTTPKSKKPALIPPDPERCQAELTTYNPFVMGGSVRQTERCKNKPGYLVSEVKPGKDGRKGAMSLCDECKRVFAKLNRPGIKYETLIPEPGPKLIAAAAKAIEKVPEDELEEHAKLINKKCKVKPHFDCDGTGQMCGVCGESENACSCDDGDLENCKDCNGTGRFCVEHDSGCDDLSKNPKCDGLKELLKQ